MFVSKFPLCEGESGGEGTGGAAGDSNNPNVAAIMADLDASKAEVERLRAHSAKLLDEKKGLKGTLDKFGDLDPEKFAALVKQLDGSEEARLLAEGNIDEVVNKRTERTRLEAESKLAELQKQLESKDSAVTTWQQKYNESVANQQLRIAAEKAGVIPSAIDDVLARANGVFKVDDKGNLEARDSDGNLVTVGSKPLNPDLFVESLKNTAPHYWPVSQSGGANGGTGGGADIKNPFLKGTKDYSVTDQAKLRRTDPELAVRLSAEADAAGKG